MHPNIAPGSLITHIAAQDCCHRTASLYLSLNAVHSKQTYPRYKISQAYKTVQSEGTAADYDFS